MRADKARNSFKRGVSLRLGLLSLILLTLFLFAVSVFVAPQYFLRLDLGQKMEQLTPDQLAKATNDVRTTLLQGLGGLVLIAGAAATWRQVIIARDQVHQTQAYTEEQLRISRRQLQQTQELTMRQLTSAEETQITERFTRAIEHLGDETLDVRLGGIYALERIGNDSPADRGAIEDILASYVRVHAPWKPRVPRLATLPGVSG
jgi:hypothetical protein